MTNQTIAPQELIPEYRYGIYVPTEEDLIFLGKENLEQLKQYWHRKRKQTSEKIEYLQSKIDILEDKTVEDLKIAAEEYEHPDFPKIGIRENSRNNLIEPLDAASMNRASDATTFNFCGWCKHTSGGLCRYRYCTETHCALIPSYPGDKPSRFDTPCILISRNSQSFLDACVSYLKAKRAKLIAERERYKSFVHYLNELEEKAEEKPCLVDLRPYDWFNPDEEIMWLVGDLEDIIPDEIGKFVSGKVIDGYRHHDGVVSVYLDKKVHTGVFCEGYGCFAGSSYWGIFKKWEYDYLKSHLDYLKVWTRNAMVFPDFKLEDFEKSLFS